MFKMKIKIEKQLIQYCVKIQNSLNHTTDIL